MNTQAQITISVAIILTTLLFLLTNPIWGDWPFRRGGVEQEFNETMMKLQSDQDSLKFIMRQGTKIDNRCKWMMKDGPVEQSEVEEHLVRDRVFTEQICDHFRHSRFPKRVIITVMSHWSVPSLNRDLDWIQKMQGEVQIDIQFKRINPMAFAGQIRDKLSQQNEEQYLRQIGEALHSMHPMQHCRYTHQSCVNNVIYFVRSPQYEGVEEVQGVFFINARHLQRCILKILKAQGFKAVQQWKRYQKLANLNNLHTQIRHLQNMFSTNQRYITSEQKIIEFLSQAKQYANSSHLDLDLSLPNAINELSLNQQDLFPTEYKVGVYLPIVLLFLIFPIATLLKSAMRQ